MTIRSLEKYKSHFLPLAILLIATFAVYSGTFQHDFLTTWDDDKYVTANEAVKGFSLEHLKAAFTTFYLGNYAPIQIISYMLDYSLWGMEAGGFLLTNILLHAANGLLFYALLIRISGSRVWAFLASFIFLCHPVQVETVAWVSQRKNLLAMLFFLIAFHLYLAWKESGPGKGRTAYILSVLSFTLSLLAKSVTVILPPLLLLFDLCFPAEGKRKRWLADKLPYVAAAAAMAMVTLKSQLPEFEGGRADYYGGGPIGTLFTMLPVFVGYLRMAVWPAGLSADYLIPIRSTLDAAVIWSAALLAAVFSGGYFLYRTRRDLFFWFALFFIALIPVSQIVPIVTLMNDRYLYFPMLGGGAFIGGALTHFSGRIGGMKGKTAMAVICLLALTLPYLSWRRAEVWQNGITLWSDVVHKTPGNYIALTSLADSYREVGNQDEAVRLYQKALALNSRYFSALNNLSNLYLQRGELAQARENITRLIREYPKYPRGFEMLGIAYEFSGDLEKAESAYSQALHLDPTLTESLISLGVIYLQRGDMEKAKEFFAQARAAGGESAELAYSVACLETRAGNLDEALLRLDQAIKLGMRDFEKIEQDPCMAPLRSLPAYRGLFTSAREGTTTRHPDK